VRNGQRYRCKALLSKKIMTVFEESALANSVPAAAVTQGVQMLFIIIGCKGYVGCLGLDIL
jgi:hypothetical protein